jgi:DNA helicase-2/ATP-dependent DNA helicase PcrA
LINNIKERCIPTEELDPQSYSVFTLFNQQIQAVKKFTYSDTLITFIKLIERNLLKSFYSNKFLKFDYIMCDEVNDNSKLQFEMVRCVLSLNPGAKLTLVGDLLQALYTWRTANPELCLDFVKQYNMQVKTLSLNFRSHGHMINTDNTVLDIVDQFSDMKVPIKCSKSLGELVKFYQFGNADSYLKQLQRDLLDLLDQGQRPSDIVILFRKNMSGYFIDKYLTNKNIPFKLLKGSFIDRKIIKCFLNIIRFCFFTIYNPDDFITNDVYLLDIASEVSSDVADETFNLLKKNFDSCPLLDVLENLDSVSIKGIGNVKKLALKNFYCKIQNMIKVFRDHEKNIGNVINELYNFILEFKSFRSLSVYERDQNADDVEQLIDILTESEGSNIIEKINSFCVDFISDADQKDKKEFIYGMTIHQAKGLEYKTVLFIDIQECLSNNIDKPEFQYDGVDSDGNLLPKEEQLVYKGMEENKRCFYVATTRAKEKLFMYCIGKFSYYNEIFKDNKSVKILGDLCQS